VRRVLSAFAAAVLTAAFLCPPTAARADRGDQWHAIATTALTKFEARDNVGDLGNGGGTLRTSAYGWAAEASGRLRGWNDARTKRYLTKVLSQKNPDGGYGIGYAYDALGDGTINPATTTYTVTVTHHVGEAFLEAYRAGVLPDAELRSLVTLVMTTTRIDRAEGQCVAYSRHPNDAAVYACVHNVNAGAGMFLLKANALGVGRSGQAALIEGITRRETWAYLADQKTWRYMDTRALSDADHVSYSAESMLYLAPQLGSNLVYQMMTTAYADNAKAPVVHMRLTGVPNGIGLLPAAPSRWCALGDRWLAEAETYVAGLTDANDLAQAAQLAARASGACGGHSPDPDPTEVPTGQTSAPDPDPTNPTPPSFPPDGEPEDDPSIGGEQP
jgi:hypothetical protein